MIDVKLPVRKAFYDLLSGVLTLNANLIPVMDDAKNLGDPSMTYVLLSSQTGTSANSFQTFDSVETMLLDIVSKAGARTNKETADLVAAQIIPLVITAPGTNGLVPDPSIQINCVELSDDRYLTMALNSSNTVVRRLLTFKMRVRQTGTTTPPTPIPSFRNPIVSADFANATEYINGHLKGRTFLLYLNGIGFLTSDQYGVLPDGGFQILLNNFDSTQNSYTFFLLLQ